ncbi:endonuclease/exonuclease/phosphatase family protein [Nocardioides speluncae]|uniref:endonuclease/exonuclease/phosphatase family protein n=1 Tax=Nocardioides speluncae TaxID=2670337 RepID=UPI0012B17AE2|nr:endonuclease/exonuclease/phosphatase family protein [Nocardioides speluncae]
MSRPLHLPRLLRLLLVVVLAVGGTAGAVAAGLTARGGDQAEAGSRLDRLPAPQGIVVSRTFPRDKQRDLRLKAQAEARKAAKKKARLKKLRGKSFSFQIASFNVLGSHHTVGSNRWASGVTRAGWTADVMNGYGTDVIGTQELQADQLAVLQSRTGWAAYPGLELGEDEVDNSILWDDKRFELVSTDTVDIPFYGRPRPQPIVRLRNRVTKGEFYVTNWHPPSGRDGKTTAEREAGWAIQVDTVSRLTETGLPVFVTGDMNDRGGYYCAVTPQLVSSYPPIPCKSDRTPPVDWIMGAGGVAFSKYADDRGDLVRRTSDHFYISVTASIQ